MSEGLVEAGRITRPTALVRAARLLAAREPDRERLLARVLGRVGKAWPHDCARAVSMHERDLEERRSTADLSYRPQAHVEALAALLIELGRLANGDHANASGSDAFRLAAKSSRDSRTPASSAGA